MFQALLGTLAPVVVSFSPEFTEEFQALLGTLAPGGGMGYECVIALFQALLGTLAPSRNDIPFGPSDCFKPF